MAAGTASTASLALFHTHTIFEILFSVAGVDMNSAIPAERNGKIKGRLVLARCGRKVTFCTMIQRTRMMTRTFSTMRMKTRMMSTISMVGTILLTIIVCIMVITITTMIVAGIRLAQIYVIRKLSLHFVLLNTICQTRVIVKKVLE